MDTLFTTPELSPESLARRRILGMGLKVLGGTALLGGLGGSTWAGYTAVTGKSPSTLFPASEKDLQLTVLTYMDSKRYSNPDFGRQVTGTEAKFADIEDGQVFFTLPKGLPDKAETLEKLAKNPKLVRSSQFVMGRERLDDYTASPGFEIISMPLSEFIVDPNRKVVIGYQKMPFKTEGVLFYDVTVSELNGFLSNRRIYGGPQYANEGIARFGKKVLLPNLGGACSRKRRAVIRALGLKDYRSSRANGGSNSQIERVCGKCHPI